MNCSAARPIGWSHNDSRLTATPRSPRWRKRGITSCGARFAPDPARPSRTRVTFPRLWRRLCPGAARPLPPPRVRLAPPRCRHFPFRRHRLWPRRPPRRCLCPGGCTCLRWRPRPRRSRSERINYRFGSASVPPWRSSRSFWASWACERRTPPRGIRVPRPRRRSRSRALRRWSRRRRPSRRITTPRLSACRKPRSPPSAPCARQSRTRRAPGWSWATITARAAVPWRQRGPSSGRCSSIRISPRVLIG